MSGLNGPTVQNCWRDRQVGVDKKREREREFDGTEWVVSRVPSQRTKPQLERLASSAGRHVWKYASLMVLNSGIVNFFCGRRCLMHHTMDGHDDGLCFVPWSVMSVYTRTSVVLFPQGLGRWWNVEEERA